MRNSTAHPGRRERTKRGRNDQANLQFEHTLRNVGGPTVAVPPDYCLDFRIGVAALTQPRGNALRPGGPAERLDDSRTSGSGTSRYSNRSAHDRNLDRFESARG